MKRSRIGPKNYEDALTKRTALQQRKRELKVNRRTPMKRSRMKTYRVSPEEKALRREVLERDKNRCQWPGGCTTGDIRIDVHHLAERSQRPDLKLSAENCKAICRTHHDWIPLNRARAIEVGLLNPETYEAAIKQKRDNQRLMKVVSEFRSGILQGRKSNLMCVAVCSPLEGYLRAIHGIDTHAVCGTIDEMEHFWLEMGDGRIIDPTADQFLKPDGNPMPEVYVGELPAWYGGDG